METPSSEPDTVLAEAVFHVATAVAPAASAFNGCTGEVNTEIVVTNTSKAVRERFMLES